MSVGKLTDEERRARALTIDQITQKIKDEYGDALALLGMLPVVERVWPYTVEDHVEFARSRGITLDPDALRIQREYLDLLRSASVRELSFVVKLLTKLLDFDRLKSTDRNRLVHEMICILSSAEVTLTTRRIREAERADKA